MLLKGGVVMVRGTLFWGLIAKERDGAQLQAYCGEVKTHSQGAEGVSAWKIAKRKLQGKEGFRVLLNECLLTVEPGARTLLFPSAGNLSNPGIEPRTPSLQADFFFTV